MKEKSVVLLDNRLLACADFATGNFALDVGTDHGLLPAHLLLCGKCEKVIAADINEEPLLSAKKTLSQYNLLDKAELVLSDGLENIQLDGVTDIIIAGMGGELIAEILSPFCEDLHGKNLILQPMTKQHYLQNWLYNNGFFIHGEKTVMAKNRKYTIFNVKYGDDCMRVSDIIAVMEKIAPLSLTTDDDNAGLLVGNMNDKASKIMLVLDITKDVILEAEEKGADVIIAHHPIIYYPLLKSVSDSHPAGLALKKGIACVCYHTSLDAAYGGINDMIFDLLQEPLGLVKCGGFIEDTGKIRGIGLVCDLTQPVEPKKAAHVIKSAFGCTVLKYHDGKKPIKRLGFCSGGGGSLLNKAVAMGVDGYLTGDLRNHEWITAVNDGISLFDAGHYHTEVISVPYLKECFRREMPDVEVIIADNCKDPVEYLVN